MEKTVIKGFKLIGLALEGKTTNENGRSNIDCGDLWQKFESEGYFNRIPGKKGDEIYAVYHNYEGDHMKPFSYFIGCKVASDTTIPENMDSLTIPEGAFINMTAKGKMPDCISDAWKSIWSSDISRAFTTDFEVYDERSRDWSNAEVDIYLSVK